jgi:hypothetical protein
MDREERLQALNKIEGQLSQYLAADKKNWIQTYLLMSEVQDKELYIVNYRSYTKWVNHLADSLSIHVSTLWSRLKAGKNYAEYASRAREQGRIVPQIEEIDVSPDSLNLCAKVAGKNATEMDKLVDQVLAGDLTRENLRQAAGGFVATSKFDCIQAKDRTEMAEKITAADIILALQSSDWLFEQDVTNPVWEKVITDPREPVKKTYIKEKYRIFEEFPVNSGTSRHSRRLDALIVENISVPARADNPVNLIGVEIKVDVNDLKNDCKMQEYTNFVDQFYLAISDEKDIVNAALSTKLDSWGLLTVSKDGQIKVLQTADKLPAIMRDKTLNSLVLKLL